MIFSFFISNFTVFTVRFAGRGARGFVEVDLAEEMKQKHRPPCPKKSLCNTQPLLLMSSDCRMTALAVDSIHGFYTTNVPTATPSHSIP